MFPPDGSRGVCHRNGSVHQSLHLPTRVVVTKNDGLEIIRADFPGLTERSINAGVRKKDFARPAAWKKYTEVIEE